MKTLVTGSAGFIGFHLAKRLLDDGDSVVGLDNINDYYDIRLKYDRLAEVGIEEKCIRNRDHAQSSRYPHYRFVKMDLTDFKSLEKLFKKEKFDRICHFAAQAGVRYSLTNPHAFIESNIVGFINLIDLCRYHPIRHFLYASSSSVYGLGESMPFSIRSDSDRPASLYGATKKSNELIAHSYSYLFGLPTTGLRFFTVYGPWGRPDMAYFAFTKAIIEGKAIDIYNHGKMERDFTFIDDCIEGIVRALDKPAAPGPDVPYRIYNIGHGSPVRLLEIIKAIEKGLGRKAYKNMLPMHPTEVRSTWADTSDLLRDFGYRPETDIQSGIDCFISWYLNHYHITDLLRVRK